MAFPLLISSLFISLSFLKQSATANLQFCPQSSCSPENIQIRFPFGLNSDNPRCTFPGFDLSCNNESQTVLNLPLSGDFLVTHIDYRTQRIRIRDPGNCLAARFIGNFSLEGSPFVGVLRRSEVFLNCSASNISQIPPLPMATYVGCLSDENVTVLAVPSEFEDYARGITACGVLASDVYVPVMWSRVLEDTTLFWVNPDCTECEQNGGICGFKEGLGYDIGCLGQRSKGLSRGAKYGLTIGAGIPGLLIIIGLSCYLCGRFRTHNRSLARPSAADHLSTRPQLISINGLDGSTIELYPKTLLGESRRLPKPNDNTCPICLSEYQPKETIRTIPECNHYFHAECIDEWLKMNASCPLCRNSPDVGSIHTPSSSSSVATPSSSLSESSSSLYSGR